MVALAILTIASPVFGQHWRAITPRGPIADIEEVTVDFHDGRYMHSAIITPLVEHLGVRLWCNGHELPSYYISNPATAHFTDSRLRADWEWQLSTAYEDGDDFWLQRLDR